MLLTGRRQRTGGEEYRDSSARATLAAAVLGFFMITLDAVIVSIALPWSIREEFGGGIIRAAVGGGRLHADVRGAAAVAGSLSDRVGARRAFAAGLSCSRSASAACGLAPGLARSSPPGSSRAPRPPGE